MNPFKSKGFDSIIAKGVSIAGTLTLNPGTTTQLDGSMSGDAIRVSSEVQFQGADATIVINGSANALSIIDVPNVTITGEVTCKTLTSTGVLAIKNGARVTCDRLQYNVLIVETGAIITGRLEHIGAFKSAAEAGTKS